MTIKNSFKEVVGYFKEATQLILVNKKLVVYAAFFALAGGVFSLIKNIIPLIQYLQFYNPFWSGFSLDRVLSFKNWFLLINSSLFGAFSFNGLAWDIIHLSSANLISIGVLVAALFFSNPLKEFFRKNDFAWQIAFYSFGASMIFLPLFWFFSKVFKVVSLAGFFTAAEGIALSVFLTILLTFFEAVFLYVIKLRLAKQAYTREYIFELASGVFKPLFIFNLFWVFLNPINFSGLFSAPAFLSFLAVNFSFGPIFALLQKILSVAFVIFSALFVFVPLILVFYPATPLLVAMKKSLNILKTNLLSIVWLFIFGLLLQVTADFIIGFFGGVISLFGFGEVFVSFFVGVIGPLFYATALLIFISAAIKFLNDYYTTKAVQDVQNQSLVQ